jgi:cell division protein FtsW (lipid II flippase)
MAVSRTDTSVLGRWWWSVDRWTLMALLALVAIGYVMMLSARRRWRTASAPPRATCSWCGR